MKELKFKIISDLEMEKAGFVKGDEGWTFKSILQIPYIYNSTIMRKCPELCQDNYYTYTIIVFFSPKRFFDNKGFYIRTMNYKIIESYDVMDENPYDGMEFLNIDGWSGNYKKKIREEVDKDFFNLQKLGIVLDYSKDVIFSDSGFIEHDFKKENNKMMWEKYEKFR